MSIKSFSWFVAAMALLAGCVPSFHPIYTEKDLIFEPALLGSWSEDDGDETWTLSAHEPGSYRLVVKSENGTEGVLVAHLVEIAGRRFLDLLPGEQKDRMNEFYQFHLIRSHTFFLVEQIDPHLRISYMDPEWISKYVEEHPASILHERVDDRVVLTAPTEKLQEFFMQHIETPGAYSEPSELKRLGN